MAWIFDTYSMNKGHSVLGVVTGKPLNVGGSLGRLEATARGCLYTIQEAVRKQEQSLGELKVAVQGFGNVGSFLSKFLAEEGSTVVAVSDSTSGLYNPNGIDIPAALAHKQETGSLHGLRGADEITNEELLVVDCDVLAPSALEQVITTDNADKIKASIICEGANGPITPSADSILDERGVMVLPDILANAGGVVVSYFEWVQGLQEYFWKEPEVNSKLRDIVTRAFNETWHLAQERQTSMRSAAYGVAVGRVAEATVTRGLYPVRLRRSTTPRVATSASGRSRRCACSTASSPSSSRRSRSTATPSSRRATASSIPVVEIDGEQVFTYYVHEQAFRRRLAAAQTRP